MYKTNYHILLSQFYCNLNFPKNNFKEMGYRQPGVKFILSQVHYCINDFQPPCSVTSQTFGLPDKFYETFGICADINHLQIATFARQVLSRKNPNSSTV